MIYVYLRSSIWCVFCEPAVSRLMSLSLYSATSLLADTSEDSRSDTFRSKPVNFLQTSVNSQKVWKLLVVNTKTK